MSDLISKWHKRGAVVGVVITVFGTLFNVLEIIPKLLSTYEHAWTLYFVPDIIILCGLVLLAVSAAMTFANRFFRSLMEVLSAHPWWQRSCVVLLLLIIPVVCISSEPEWKELYRWRVFEAKFDWEYLRAKEHLLRGEYPEALKSFAKIRGRFVYLPEFYRSRSQNEQRDITQRIDDVKAYLRRYARAIASGQASLPDVLLVQRASRLDPDSQDVLAASRDAQHRVHSALDSYLSAVKAMQSGDKTSCRSALSQSFASGIRIFHSDLLWRYCSGVNPQAFAPSELELLDAYKQGPADRLHQVFMSHPWVSSLDSLPTAPAPRGAATYRERRTESERSSDRARRATENSKHERTANPDEEQ